MKVVNFVIKTGTSKKGNEYTGLYAVLDNGQEIFITFVNLKK